MTSSKKLKTTVPPKEFATIPQPYQHFAAISILVLSLIFFFHELVFEGKVFLAADNIASKSFQTLVSDAEERGIFPLWNPYIFCGMPGYASLMIHGERYFDITALVLNRASKLFGVIINSQDVGWALFYYLILGIGTYWFVFEKVKNKIAALVSGLAVMHSTFIIILVMVGHMTKVPVIAFFPIIFLVLEKLQNKNSLLLFVVLSLLIHFMLLPGHIQMIFYCYLAIGFYFIFYLIRALIKKDPWKGIVRSGLVFAAASCIALAMSGDQYLSVLEYSKYSMRGSNSIESTTNRAVGSENNGGLDYDYATNWSFSPGEIMTFFIPSSHGFGWHTYRGVLSQNQSIRLNTYFGNMPFTDAPQYMGIVVLVFAGIGFWKNKKEVFVQYSVTLILLSLLLSFGKEFPLFYDAMFYYFPMFDKFRIPSMVLILIQIFIPILAGYGIASMVSSAADKNVRQLLILKNSVIVIGAMLILTLVAKDVFISVYQFFQSQNSVTQNLARSYGNNQNVLIELYKVISEMVLMDITIALFFLTISLGAFFLYLSKKISMNILVIIIVGTIIADLWRINYKPMDTKPQRESSEYFSMPGHVSYLKKDSTLYRTLEFENGHPPYNNTLAYWRIQSAYGYSGTKMRQIQDMFDVAGLGNPLVWGLMNVKYILSDQPDSNNILHVVHSSNGRYLLNNKSVLPRAFFVKRYEVANGYDILTKIKNMSFDPLEVAYFLNDPMVSIDPPGTNASVSYSTYGIQDITLNVTATGNNLLFLSESWYPEGWKAYLNSTEVPIHRINYMFRGVIIPQGSYSLEMKFEPTGFFIGKTFSLILNIFIVGILFFYGLKYFHKKNQPSH